MEKEERFSVRLVELADGSTFSELTGDPTPAQVLGLLEMYRAVQRLQVINAFSAAQERAVAGDRESIELTPEQVRRLSWVLHLTRDEGPGDEGWQSDELRELRDIVEEVASALPK